MKEIDPLTPQELAELQSLLRKAAEAREQLENKMLAEIETTFNELKTRFENIHSPDRPQLIENKIAELDDLFHSTDTLDRRKYYTRIYFQKYILQGEMKVIEKPQFGGSVATREYDWIIDAHASYRFLLWLQQPGYSVSTVAMALIIKDITINKKGVGVKDQIDYTKKFNITSPNTLYHTWRDLAKDSIGQNKYRAKAQELIKNESL